MAYWIVAALLVVGSVLLFNRLVRLRNEFGNAFAQIDVQLTRRYELIPNLVETAKAYLRHERETLESVVLARNAAADGLRAAAASPRPSAWPPRRRFR
jgi:LemA protein